jgi:hypothetical protein
MYVHPTYAVSTSRELLGIQRVIDFAAGLRFSRELQVQEACV